MSQSSCFIAVRSSLHSLDSAVFGLTNEEMIALSKKYGSYNEVINGVIIKASPIKIINSLSEIGYKVVCCAGDSELTWTMMPNCVKCCHNSTASQTLEELDFERGIWYAAQCNDISKVKQCIDKFKDVNIEDKAGYTALHYASRSGHLEMCELLILNGANVNALTGSGKVSSLHRCATMGHLDIFKLLLRSGALMNIKDGDGKTVLHRAVEGGHSDIVEEILKREPSLAMETDNRGCLPRHHIKNSQSLQDLFTKYK